jgi:hypothetical protein
MKFLVTLSAFFALVNAGLVRVFIEAEIIVLCNNEQVERQNSHASEPHTFTATKIYHKIVEYSPFMVDATSYSTWT